MQACFEASKTPIPQPQVLIHVPLNFCPKSLPQLTHRLYVSPLPKSPFPVFPFSSRLPPPTSNLFEWHFRPAHSLTPLRLRSHRRRRRRGRRRTRRRAQTTEGGRDGLISPSHSFVPSFSFLQWQRLLDPASCLPRSLACFVPLARLHVERRRRRRISPWGKGEG